MNVVRAMVSLFEPGSGNIFIHESFGLSEEEQAKGVYFLGEGVTGRVVETGEAIVVPRIGDEPSFLDRTQSRSASDRRLSFLCVPIMRSKKVLERSALNEFTIIHGCSSSTSKCFRFSRP